VWVSELLSVDVTFKVFSKPPPTKEKKNHKKIDEWIQD